MLSTSGQESRPSRGTARLHPFRLALLALVATAMPAGAATNAVTAGIGGLDNGTLTGGDGTGTGQITLNTVELALVKQARRLDGVVLADSADVFPGDEIYFVLHVDNPADHPATDVRLTDPLDEASFAYVAGSLEVTTVPTGSSDDALWSGSWTSLTDAAGAPDDVGAVTDTGGDPGPDLVTIGAVDAQANTTLDVPGGQRMAFRFRVTVR